MPRKNSTTWNVGNPVTATRLNHINSDIDDIYAYGSDRLRIYQNVGDAALFIRIGAGRCRVGTVEVNFAGNAQTYADNTNYWLMVNSAGNLVLSNSGYDGQNLSLGRVITSGGVATIIQEKPDSVGGDFGGNPIGTVLMWSTNTAPTGYLLCNGQAVSRTTYAGLFSLISTTYGVGDGSTTFNVPNLMGRVAVGRDAGQTEFDVLGETGGAKTHTLSSTEMPVHRHNVPLEASNAAANGSLLSHGTISNPFGTKDTSDTGGGQAHNNLQPYLVLNYIIKS